MEDIWVIFYDDEGKELSFGNVGKVTDWISKWKSWRGNSKSKQPYIDGKVKFRMFCVSTSYLCSFIRYSHFRSVDLVSWSFSKLYKAKNNRNPKRDQLIAYNGKVFYHETKEEDIWELDLYKCKIKSLNSCVTMTKSPLVQVRLEHMKIRLKLPVALFSKR